MRCGISANLWVCWAGILAYLKKWSYWLPFYTYLCVCFCIYSFHIDASCAPPPSCQSLSSLLGFICRPPQSLGYRGISLAAPITQTQNLPVASSEKISCFPIIFCVIIWTNLDRMSTSKQCLICAWYIYFIRLEGSVNVYLSLLIYILIICF